MGTGKSTLALDLSRRLSGPAGCCQILELDPDDVYREIRTAAGPLKILGHYSQKKMER